MTSNGNGHAAEVLTGTVELVNDRGYKIDGKWWNRSKWAKLEQIDDVVPGQRVELRLDGSGFIRVLTRLEKAPAPQREYPEDPDQGPDVTERRPLPSKDVQIIRESCIKSAAAFCASRADLKSCDLFALAERMEGWIRR